MINISENNSVLSITNGAEEIFRFDLAQKFATAGQGKAKYIMSHGGFKFKDKVSSKIDLYLRIVNSNTDIITCELADKTGCRLFELVFSTTDHMLKIHFKALTESDYNRLWLKLPAKDDEHVYGCGETYTAFDLRGEKVKIWVAEHNNALRIARKVIAEKIRGKKPEKKLAFSKYQSYYAQPTFVSSRKYFIHIDTHAYAEFDFTHKETHGIALREPADIYIGFANDYENLMTTLTDLLGRQPPLPEWAYNGAILGIQGGTEAVLAKLKKSDSFGMKVAGVWCQDWEGARITMFGKQLMWNWKWDSEHYKDLDKELPKLKEKGIKFLGYCNPFLAIEKDLYEFAASKGYCVKDKDGKDYLVKITTFPAAMVDLTNPDAYEWIKSVIKDNMIGFGLDGWMADFGEYLPTDCVLYSGEDAQKVHNTWPVLWARANREAVEESGKLGEIFFFTRAGYTGTGKYSTLMWNGDQHVDWSYDEGLASAIPASLSLAVSGFGLSHSDVGGYTTFSHIRREQEVLMRWAEMNVFTPLFRSHEGNRPDDNVQFDANDEVIAHYAHMSRLHFALAPYLKQADALNSEKGIPVMRPLFFYYHDKSDYSEMYEYLLGRDILVAPVLKKGCTQWPVYLPDDTWIHLWSGKAYSKGNHMVEAPLGNPPVFCRESSVYLNKFLKLKNC